MEDYEDFYNELKTLVDKAVNSDKIEYVEIIGALETAKLDVYNYCPVANEQEG
ncbi:hypothetical protein KAR91_81400 [Candidatus Pacearchaeota archaeon]|nr:hypothetical protein [Candidatus Pacearchaeota archaeon]